MSDEELFQETTSVIGFDESEYSDSDYPDQYLPLMKSSFSESTQGLKSIKITSKQKTPQNVVVRMSAKLMSRKDKIRQINKIIKHSPVTY